ncbi:hypothetical protein [Roseicyclus marinus]|uniref:hypothetical protein n=1 Tax=Roseicyclus marinus TaxID=2161673 RepID=UPI00240F4589|nr:hypothetical protein [Roseicyclus marinus]MDG3041310.1 hypothetical protein [Roseicyclus marinus]
MSTGQIIQLVLQGLVFIAWAGLMFRTLFLLRARAADQTGTTFPGPGQFIAQAGHWLRSDEDRAERKTLGFMTFVLLAMSLSTAFLGSPAAG